MPSTKLPMGLEDLRRRVVRSPAIATFCRRIFVPRGLLQIPVPVRFTQAGRNQPETAYSFPRRMMAGVITACVDAVLPQQTAF